MDPKDSGEDHVTAASNVEDLLTRYSAAARVFVRRRMSCVGCDIARFESLAGVCQVYRQPVDLLLAEIRQVVAAHIRRHYAREHGGHND